MEPNRALKVAVGYHLRALVALALGGAVVVGGYLVAGSVGAMTGLVTDPSVGALTSRAGAGLLLVVVGLLVVVVGRTVALVGVVSDMTATDLETEVAAINGNLSRELRSLRNEIPDVDEDLARRVADLEAEVTTLRRADEGDSGGFNFDAATTPSEEPMADGPSEPNDEF